MNDVFWIGYSGEVLDIRGGGGGGDYGIVGVG